MKIRLVHILTFFVAILGALLLSYLAFSIAKPLGQSTAPKMINAYDSMVASSQNSKQEKRVHSQIENLIPSQNNEKTPLADSATIDISPIYQFPYANNKEVTAFQCLIQVKDSQWLKKRLKRIHANELTYQLNGFVTFHLNRDVNILAEQLGKLINQQFHLGEIEIQLTPIQSFLPMLYDTDSPISQK